MRGLCWEYGKSVGPGAGPGLCKSVAGRRWSVCLAIEPHELTIADDLRTFEDELRMPWRPVREDQTAAHILCGETGHGETPLADGAHSSNQCLFPPYSSGVSFVSPRPFGGPCSGVIARSTRAQSSATRNHRWCPPATPTTNQTSQEAGDRAAPTGYRAWDACAARLGIGHDISGEPSS